MICNTLAVLSSEAVIRLRLSFEKETERTAALWPFNDTDSPFLHYTMNIRSIINYDYVYLR